MTIQDAKNEIKNEMIATESWIKSKSFSEEERLMKIEGKGQIVAYKHCMSLLTKIENT